MSDKYIIVTGDFEVYDWWSDSTLSNAELKDKCEEAAQETKEGFVFIYKRIGTYTVKATYTEEKE
jgi:hypothetical protein